MSSPDVCSTQNVRKRKEVEDRTSSCKRYRNGNYEWQGEPIESSEPLERSLGLNTWRDFTLQGHFAKECSFKANSNMLLDFLQSRPGMKGILGEPVPHFSEGTTYFRHEVQFYPFLEEPLREKDSHKKHLQGEWTTSFHWTRFNYIYGILLYGLKALEDARLARRVFSFKKMLRGKFYQCYTHMPDGVCYSITCELDIDETMTHRLINQKLATQEEYVHVRAVWVSALTVEQLYELMQQGERVTLLGMWDPASEIIRKGVLRKTEVGEQENTP